MGYLWDFQLGPLMHKYNTRTFLETGTGGGDGVQFAQFYAFDKIYSVELLDNLMDRIRARFASDSRVDLRVVKSIDVLREIPPAVKGNTLFWLDAHFPGEYTDHAPMDAEGDVDVRLPLEKELALIKELRPDFRDVILIDDLWIYERDKFEWGNLTDRGHGHAIKHDSGFLYKIFDATHTVQRSLRRGGYLMLTPKDT